MKKAFVFVVCCFITLASDGVASRKITAGKSQETSSENNKEYTVKSGDTWYSIARKMGLSFSELRLANKGADKVLKVGQVIAIPGKAKPEDPRNKKNYMNESAMPVSSAARTHTVSSGETVFSISKKYGVTTDQLTRWNNIKGNSIKVGQVLKVSEDEEKKVVKTEKPTEEATKVTTDEKPATPKAESGTVSKSKGSTDKPLSGYIFANNRQQVTEQGTAASIVDDESNPGKYYALHRSAPVGTIIKVTNRMNDKSVFVKVVGTLPATGDNEGLLIKISKSGADKLGALDERFQVELIYGVPSK